MKNKLEKIRQSSFDELRVRGSQSAAALAERWGLSRHTRLLSDKALFEILELPASADLSEHFRERKCPRFFPAFDDPAGTIAQLRKRRPSVVGEIIERADRITTGHFDLLGFRQLSFGDPVDWHLEPVAGKRAPLVHWSRLNYLDADRFGDKKIIWELNRHQYFATLGQAYWLTGDERYANTCVAHINSWCVENPPKLGINWASSLEVSFRSISWIWALHFFKRSPSFTAETIATILKFLYLNALHLETFLSTYFSPNTHLTGEALGLFYIGTMLPEFKESVGWRKTGLQILLEQLDRHVQPDGVYFEQSSYYHRYTTDFYLHLRILLAANGEPVPKPVDEKLQQLLDFLMYITRPDGRTPLFGDDDGGRLMRLDYRAADDFRSTLYSGAAVFNRGDYKFVAGDAAEETLWLLGASALENVDRVSAMEPAKQSIEFADSGYYIMRDSWKSDANYLFFDCGHHGADNCGHAHADALSFEMATKGHTMLVDPGTYTYTASKEMRDSFRTSASHNTLTVDGESWSVPAGPFSWKVIGTQRRSDWISKTRFDYIAASQRRSDRHELEHRREILFLKNYYWIIRDFVDLPGTHDLKLFFHFDSNTTLSPGEDRTVLVRPDGEAGDGLQITTLGTLGEWARESGWVSHCYGERDEAPVCTFSVRAEGPAELITLLVPGATAPPFRPPIMELEALNGKALAFKGNENYDVLLLTTGRSAPDRGKIETARFASDFDLAWFRFAGEGATYPEEMVLIGGKTVELDGRILLKSVRTIDYLVASRVGDRFRLETSAGELEIRLPVLDLESLFTDLHEQSAT